MSTNQTMNKEEVDAAFSIFKDLMTNGVIPKKNNAHYANYQRPEVRDIIEDTICSLYEVRIFESNEGLHMVPELGNSVFQHSNEELRQLMQLKNNDELYLGLFSILVLLSKFYNSQSLSYSTVQYIELEEYEKSINAYISKLSQLSKTRKEDLSEEFDLNIEGIVSAWQSLPIVKEDAKNIRRAKGRISLLLRVLKFLESQGLVTVLEDKEIMLEEKMDIIIHHYYNNTERKEKLMSFFNQ